MLFKKNSERIIMALIGHIQVAYFEKYQIYASYPFVYVSHIFPYHLQKHSKMIIKWCLYSVSIRYHF